MTALQNRILSSVLALAFLALGPPAHAQKTKAQLNSEIVVSFPDNVVGAITPQVLRNVTSDIVNSIAQVGVVNPVAANYSILPSDCGNTVQAGSGSTGLFTVVLPAVTGFVSNCTITVVNGDIGREKVLSGFPATLLPTLWPLQALQVSIINSSWVATFNPGKWRPTAATVFNVSATGIDAVGCTLGTGAAACATGLYAMTTVCQNVDPSMLPSTPFPQITIQYAAGAYTSTNIIGSFCDPGPLPFVGSMQGGWLKVAGNTNLTSVTLNCGANVCFSPVHSAAGWWVEGFATTGTSYSVVADAGTHLYLGTNKFGTTGGSAGDVNAAYGSLVEFEANFTTTGSKSGFVSANQSGSRVIFKPVTVTLSSSTFTIPYVVNTNAIVIAAGVTYSGAATVAGGNCYNTSTGGGLETDGGLAALVTACGGSAGTTTNPGWAN